MSRTARALKSWFQRLARSSATATCSSLGPISDRSSKRQKIFSSIIETTTVISLSPTRTMTASSSPGTSDGCRPLPSRSATTRWGVTSGLSSVSPMRLRIFRCNWANWASPSSSESELPGAGSGSFRNLFLRFSMRLIITRSNSSGAPLSAGSSPASMKQSAARWIRLLAFRVSVSTSASACAMSSLAVARVCSESPPPPEPTPMIRFSSSNLRSGSEFSKKSIIS